MLPESLLLGLGFSISPSNKSPVPTDKERIDRGGIKDGT